MSEKTTNKENQESSNPKWSGAKNRPSNRSLEREYNDNRRGRTSGGKDRNRRSSSTYRKDSYRGPRDNHFDARSESEEWASSNTGGGQRKRSADYSKRREENVRGSSKRKTEGTRSLSREIRPNEPKDAQRSGGSKVRDAQPHRDPKEKLDRTSNARREPQGGRNDRRFKRRSDQKNWGRNIRSEETSEDIRKDNDRIEKEIWLEIAGIHTIKLD